jgi:FixJ family two-component response regulator
LVYVVEDEDALRDSMGRLLVAAGRQVRLFRDARSFLSQWVSPGRPAVLVLDVRLPGMEGPELQERLLGLGVSLPVIFVTGHATVPMSVRAMKLGAVDFIEKPFRAQVLLDQISRALAIDEARLKREERVRALRERLSVLTPREREVADHVVDGESSREAGVVLGISEKTVALHRAHIMSKLKVECVADLVRLIVEARAVGASPTPGVGTNTP